MLIGILSDTHDNLTTLDRAGAVFRDRRADFIIHAGDWVSPFTVRRFLSWGMNFTGILGNNDGDPAMIREASGGLVNSRAAVLTLDGWETVVVHEPELAGVLSRGPLRLVVHGHSHQASVRREGNVLVVNPGECCGWLSGRPTAAEVDTLTGEASILTL